MREAPILSSSVQVQPQDFKLPKRFEASLQQVRHSRAQLVWLGDSITQNWERNGPQPWDQGLHRPRPEFYQAFLRSLHMSIMSK